MSIVSKSRSGRRAAMLKELEVVSGELRELRALLERLDRNQLEARDCAKLKSLLSQTIDEAEAAGQEEVVIEVEMDLAQRDPRL